VHSFFQFKTEILRIESQLESKWRNEEKWMHGDSTSSNPVFKIEDYNCPEFEYLVTKPKSLDDSVPRPNENVLAWIKRLEKSHCTSTVLIERIMIQ
jgi:hypothetical protein